MSAFCRDCLCEAQGKTCRQCGSRRTISHPELDTLSIAHLDCDAFYASIEKRDHPELRDKPVIVGGRKRGVVLTACYLARTSGVKSAMPMFQALKLCPHAVVVRPNMATYVGVSKIVRAMMRDLTPSLEPLSLDEAYLDLSGTTRLHGASPARTMASLACRIEKEIGITVSIGLSFNKFLAKLASDIDKPRGFAVIGTKEAKDFLHDKPIALMRGVGPALQAKLARDGYIRIGQLQDADARELVQHYGGMGLWLWRLANAQDPRPVQTDGERKSISSETTFDEDIRDLHQLEAVLWDQAERVSARAKASGLGGRTIVLKLKTAGFRSLTRSKSLAWPTQLADRIFSIAQVQLRRLHGSASFRLLGVGLTSLCDAGECDPYEIEGTANRRAAAERAMDRVRQKFGDDVVGKGRSMRRSAIHR